MSTEDILALQVALVGFASNVYPGRIDYIDHVLGFCVTVLEKSGQTQVHPSSSGVLPSLSVDCRSPETVWTP